MPELPEVESVRRSLLPYLPGRRVQAVVIRDPRVLVYPEAAGYQELVGQRFTELDRHGKLLILCLERQVLLVHLGMTGQLTFRDPSRLDRPFARHPYTGLERTVQHPVDAHTHVSLAFDDGTALHYRDVRKFGKWRLFSGRPCDSPELKALGPDPLTAAFTWEHFEAGLKRTRRPVKAALLDQSILAGVGNIYADEALFIAGVRPGRSAARLSGRAMRRLFEAVPQVLRSGLEAGGTSISDYVNADGEPGSNQERLQAYGRYGQPCLICGEALRRSQVAQRTSSWCRNCQS